MPTTKQRIAVKKLVENRGNVSKSMVEAGYDPTTAKNPSNLTNSKGFRELVDEFLPDTLLTAKHKELLLSTRLDHMVFPLGPKDDKNEPNPNMAPEIKTLVEAQQVMQRTKLTDKDIKDLLASVNCVVRKIVHGETGRHVYFWSADNKARKEGLDMAYKLKGSYAPEKSLNINIEANLIPNEELLVIANEINGAPKIKEAGDPGTSVPSDGVDTHPVDAEVSNQNV